MQTARRRRVRPAGRPRTGARDAVAREDVLEAALQVFAEVGYEGTSILDLTRQLGVSHNLLHARFGTKPQIWEAAVDHGLERIAQFVREADSAHNEATTFAERLRTFFIVFLLALAEYPSILKLMNYEGTRSTDRLDSIANRFLASGFAEFRVLLAEGARAGEFREVSPAALFLLAAHGGGALLCLRPLARHLGVRARRSPAVLRAQAEEVADLLLRGVLVSDDSRDR